MEYGHTTNTNLRCFMTVCLAVVIQVLNQSSLCTGITCYICENVQSSAECVDTRECASNEICRTEIRTQSSSTYRMYCQQDQACWNEEQIYESQCTGEAGSVCVHCCNTDLCRAQPQDTTPAEVATDTATTSVTVEIQTTRASTTQPAADPTGITCYVCENVQSSAECVGTQECALNEICRTEIRTQPSSITYRMACQQDQACRNEESIYESQCTGDAGSVCVHCCDTDLCRAHTQDTTTPGVTTDIATTQEITSTDTVTTQATTSESVTVEIQTTRAPPTTQPTTALTGITCYVCENVQSSAECVDTRECALNEICRTEIRTQSSSTTYRMACQQDQACRNEESIYESQCTGDAGSVCVHCCDTDLCRAQPQETTPAGVATDIATTQEITSTDTVTTQATTSESVTAEIQTARAPTTQATTAPTARPSLKDSLYRLYSSERQVHPQYVIETSTTGSLITCAMTCAHTANNCKSFGYDSMSGLCYVVGSDVSDLSFSRKQTCNHYIRVI